MKKYDLIVIGSGAGSIVIDSAIKKGLKCALVEKDNFGGTCLNRGCIPTKVMVSAADQIRQIYKTSKIGVEISNFKINYETIKKRVWEKIDENKDVKKYYEDMENVDVYNEIATFKSNKIIHLSKSDIDITSDKIVIASGARTNIPSIEGLEKIDYLTSEKIFGEDFPEKPYKSLIIVGGGAIGLEFAHIFSSLGTKVTIVQRNIRLAPKADADISKKIYEVFENYGVEVHLNSESKKIYKVDDNIHLTIKDKITGEEKEITAEKILLAPGVKSNADLLKIENTDISMDSRGYIRTNEFLETSVDGIYAIGDINGKFQLRHKANYEAEVLSNNLYEKKDEEDYRWARYDLVPSVIYTYPQISHVGLDEVSATEKGYNVKISKRYYSQAAKGYALGYDEGDVNDGFVKLIVDVDTDEFLGVQAIGYSSAMLMQPYIELMNCKKVQISPVEEEIASKNTKNLRRKKITRNLKPNTVRFTDETMVPHPSLNEVGIWTKYFNWQ